MLVFLVWVGVVTAQAEPECSPVHGLTQPMVPNSNTTSPKECAGGQTVSKITIAGVQRYFCEWAPEKVKDAGLIVVLGDSSASVSSETIQELVSSQELSYVVTALQYRTLVWPFDSLSPTAKDPNATDAALYKSFDYFCVGPDNQDYLFVDTLIDNYVGEGVDPTQIHLIGWGQGGFFATQYGIYRSGMDNSPISKGYTPQNNRVASVAVYGGADPFGHADHSWGCSIDYPISLLPIYTVTPANPCEYDTCVEGQTWAQTTLPTNVIDSNSVWEGWNPSKDSAIEDCPAGCTKNRRSPSRPSKKWQNYMLGFLMNHPFGIVLDRASNSFRLKASSLQQPAVDKLGDINGDGMDDFIIGSWSADYAKRQSAGVAYVVFGTDMGYPPTNLDKMNQSSQGCIIGGPAKQSQIGATVSYAGDVNGDGVNDILIGAPIAQNSFGLTFLIWGRASGFDNSSIDLAKLTVDQGVLFVGPSANSLAGILLAGVGDVNADGFDDIIIVAENKGQMAYLIYGGKSLPASTDLDKFTADLGTVFFTPKPRAKDDTLHMDVAALGDVNGDGLADFAISLIGVPKEHPAAYIIYGSKQRWPGFVNLTDSSLFQNGSSFGFIIPGPYAAEPAGDFNGDGLADITVKDTLDDGRRLYVLWGRKDKFPDPFLINATTWPSKAGVVISPVKGAIPNGVGDFNGDGLDDIYFGTRDTPTFIIWGVGNDTQSIDIQPLTPALGEAFIGSTRDDIRGMEIVAAGDVNSDGGQDVVVVEYHMGFSNAVDYVYIVYGTPDYTSHSRTPEVSGSIFDVWVGILVIGVILVFIIVGAAIFKYRQKILTKFKTRKMEEVHSTTLEVN